jgi:predicted nucleic acid-binding protein
MRRLFLDTTVLVHALGGEHLQRQPCRTILTAGQSGDVELHVSVEALQELLHHRLRRTDRASAVSQARRFAAGLHLHPFDTTVLTRALDLVAHTELRGRDAAHAATALEHGFDAIVTADRDFDGIPGLTRIEPADALLRS